jgi:hypothetical protein
MNKIVISVIFLLMILPTAVPAEEWQSKVSFEMPPSWKLLNSKATSSVVANLYHIREDVIDGNKYYSNAVLQYYPVPSSVSIADADRIVASRAKGATKILSADEGPLWRTYLLVNHERGEAHAVLYRIGIADGVSVELLLSFPIIRDKNESSLAVLTLNEQYIKESQKAGIYCNRSTVKEMVALFNTICTKIKISNKNQYKADVQIVDAPANAQAYRYVGESKKKE